MNRTPKPMERYRHFKGQRYQVITLAEKEDTGEQLVIYQALYGDGKVYARSLNDFLSEVDREKYPDAVQRYRFERIVPEGEETVERKQSERADACAEAAAEEEQAEDVRENANSNCAELQKQRESSEGSAESDQEEEPAVLDPLLEAFLDARTTEEKLTALDEMRGHVTDEMIDTMALASGVEVGPGPTASRYEDLRDCLVTIERYELERGRLRG